MKYPKTYQEIKAQISIGVKRIDDLNLSQRQEILIAYFEEASKADREALLNDIPIDTFTGRSLMKIGLYATPEDIINIRIGWINKCWHSVLGDLEDMFDEAEGEVATKYGAKSENDEHKLFDDKERARDMNEVMSRVFK